jgi:hypothetical protein
MATTPKIASASMATTKSQFWPNNFLRKGVMLFLAHCPGSQKDYTQVAILAKFAVCPHGLPAAPLRFD